MPEIELKRIQPNRLNPRLEFRKQALDELADSIKQVGLLEPIIIRPKGKNTYEVVIGERRYRAAQQANLNKVSVVIRNYTEEEVLELNLIENIQREDLSAVEKAKVCQEMRDKSPEKYSTWEKIAQRLGVDCKTIRSWIRTLELPEEIQRQIAPRETRQVPPGKIDYHTALHIVEKVKGPKKQIELAKELGEKHVSQRAARQIIKGVVKEPKKSVRALVREILEEAPIYLPFSKGHADAIIDGGKTQTARKTKDPRLQRGVVVRAQITHFADLEVVDVSRKRLGDFDEKDAKREGGYTLDEFKKVWKRLHGIWDPNESVYVIQFRLRKVIGNE